MLGAGPLVGQGFPILLLGFQLGLQATPYKHIGFADVVWQLAFRFGCVVVL